MAKKYELTPEHRAMLPAWRDKWIANAMSTAPMTEADRDVCRAAVNGMYAAANLAPPKHIVFVPSPFVLQFAGGMAAAIWYMHHNGEHSAATHAATSDATIDDNYYWHGVDLVAVDSGYGLGGLGVNCAQNAYSMWAGGNQWSYWDAYLSFFQDVANLGLDYTAYGHWRALAEHSGPRIVQPDFCMISDRPRVLTVDDDNRPHGENGPFCEWSDGSKIYAWHGTYLPMSWIENRATIDPAIILAEPDVEKRAAGISCIGINRMYDALGGKVLHDSGDPETGQLVEITIPDLDEPCRYLRALCPRNGWIFEGVPNTSEIDGLPILTAIAAQAWRNGDPACEYQPSPKRT